MTFILGVLGSVCCRAGGACKCGRGLGGGIIFVGAEGVFEPMDVWGVVSADDDFDDIEADGDGAV